MDFVICLLVQAQILKRNLKYACKKQIDIVVVPSAINWKYKPTLNNK